MIPSRPTLDLQPLYEALLEELGIGQETLAEKLVAVATGTIANELVNQHPTNSFHLKSRAHVIGLLRRGLADWREEHHT